jgi:hypothetical protein
VGLFKNSNFILNNYFLEIELNNKSEYTLIKEVKDLYTLKYNKNGIVEIYMHPTTFEVDKEQLMLLTDALGEIAGSNKLPIYIKASDFMGISKEAGIYSALPESNRFTLASAVLIETLAAKLLFNFYLQINKPPVPTKGFTTKESAFKWLLSFKY